MRVIAFLIDPRQRGLALPAHEFGLDVRAQIGTWRYQEHGTVAEIHQRLRDRGASICERSVTHQLERYGELVAASPEPNPRVQQRLEDQKRVILVLDGLQPQMVPVVQWVIRDCLSGEVVLARTLLSAPQDHLAKLPREVRAILPVPVAGVVTDGQQSIRKAVAKALPVVAHGLCDSHYLREAVRPTYAADQHAKKELTKRVRGIRPLERRAEKREEPEGAAIQGYCQAVRSALTDDGCPLLDAAG